MKAIEDEAKLRQPKHTRRMLLLNTNRGSDKHSNFLEKIVENYSAIEFEQMTGEELQIHLFIRDADPQMSKIATEILEKDTPTGASTNPKNFDLNKNLNLTKIEN